MGASLEMGKITGIGQVERTEKEYVRIGFSTSNGLCSFEVPRQYAHSLGVGLLNAAGEEWTGKPAASTARPRAATTSKSTTTTARPAAGRKTVAKRRQTAR